MRLLQRSCEEALWLRLRISRRRLCQLLWSFALHQHKQRGQTQRKVRETVSQLPIYVLLKCCDLGVERQEFSRGWIGLR
jgi:hypothetical protein